MNYYTKKPKIRLKIKHKSFILVIITILILFNSILYFFDKSILPAILQIAETKMTSEATKIINETSLKVYSNDFDYSDIILIEKDNLGNITMVRADTVKLNYLAAQLMLESNKRLEELEEIGIKVPVGYITKQSVIYNLGPKVTVRMEQIGNVESHYESIFESAGINQTRHKIYLNVKMKLKVIVPLNIKEIEVTSQIPISETIIVGQIPDTSIDLGNNKK
ncbi:sporulation protein YunB [Clostridium gasigenes]|uniref:sporulation protein YunB n=1 Tax=Clostridium gasigenes TaxID=94869 RepID=UPI0014382696|nr:sporulation protein YunB [Clostridium gasigenes]MBU3131288.1 sporulation protein YunB [Clostridium gasigenes]NKF08111.1 sporulation protein YunB [Clostridium gasigenes]QSW18534.1 sporulation protein YunB [Clostridium gasigenes]